MFFCRMRYFLAHSRKTILSLGLILFTIGLIMSCTPLPPGTNTTGGKASDQTDISEARGGDAYTVVDCLLPGQIRQLGLATTYVTARRPIKTTAEDCAIRGGEYVAMDRADYSTALKVWLETAEKGDKEAQYYVGTIYEKGPKGNPHYEQAQIWYRKAADQGDHRAAINLGRLYEKGLGVDRNVAEAFKWYVQASGLNESNLSKLVNQETTSRIQALEDTVADREREIQNLRKELEEVHQQLSQLHEKLQEQTVLATRERLELQRVQTLYESVRANLEMARSTPDQTALVDQYEKELQGLNAELQERQQSLEGRDEEIVRLQQKIATLQASADRTQELEKDIARREGDIQTLQAQLNTAQQELMQVRGEFQERAKAVEEERRKLRIMEEKYQTAQAELDNARSNQEQTAAIASYEEKLKTLKAEMDQGQQTVQKQDQEIAGLQAKIAALETAVKAQEKELETAAVTDLGFEGPTIEVIDPPLVMTRGMSVERGRIPLPTQLGLQRSLTGRVLAPAGLRSLRANGQMVPVDEGGIFTIELPILRAEEDRIPMDILALDIQNKRGTMRLLLAPAGAVTVAIPKPAQQFSGFGNYHALVIGNDHYQHWDPLKNAIADATAIAQVLQEQYGFQVNLLKDATRKNILGALNKLRTTLKPDDNLLIYYAGHGYLMPEIDRGYWIPVNADLDDTSEWILLPTITDHLQLMAAKHILVVADSCFSGKLTRTSLAKLRPGLSNDARFDMLKTLAQKRTRTVLTSGGLRPVLDEGEGGHSIFANAFLGVLEENDGILETERLFWAVRTRVIKSASRLNVEQIPTYSPIHLAGHESLGDFIFVPHGA